MHWKVVFILTFLAFSPLLKAQTSQYDSTKTGVYLFHNNGKLVAKGYFKNGKRHQIWSWYDSEGHLNYQIKYKNGRPLWTIYFKNNEPYERINRHGKKRNIKNCECNQH